MKIFNFLVAIGNIFLAPWVIWKIYNWFHPLTGIEFPDLDYFNIFALNILIGVFTWKPTISAYIHEMHSYVKRTDVDKDQDINKYEYLPIKIAVGYFVCLGVMYLLKIWVF